MTAGIVLVTCKREKNALIGVSSSTISSHQNLPPPPDIPYLDNSQTRVQRQHLPPPPPPNNIENDVSPFAKYGINYTN